MIILSFFKLNQFLITYYNMSNFLSFIGGSIFGAYIAQNYDIININESSKIISEYFKKIEKDNKNK
jgi:hypothetical protein